jgi:competence protein ComEA
VDGISTARGLAWLAIGGVALVLLRAGWAALAAAPVGEWAACAEPVELVGPHGVRLACASEPALQGCPVQAGDRVTSDCRLEPGGMAAATRLLVGVPLDLNRASAADLELLDGIGPKISEAIVEERARSPFATVEDLVRVRGIGPARLEAVRPFVTVE